MRILIYRPAKLARNWSHMVASLPFWILTVEWSCARSCPFWWRNRFQRAAFSPVHTRKQRFQIAPLWREFSNGSVFVWKEITVDGALKLPNAIPGTFQYNSFMDTSKAFRVCGVGDGEAGEKRQEPQRKGSEDRRLPHERQEGEREREDSPKMLSHLSSKLSQTHLEFLFYWITLVGKLSIVSTKLTSLSDYSYSEVCYRTASSQDATILFSNNKQVIFEMPFASVSKRVSARTIHVEMSSACSFIFMQIKVIIRMVSHLSLVLKQWQFATHERRCVDSQLISVRLKVENKH